MVLSYEILDGEGNVEAEIFIDPVDIAINEGVIVEDTGLGDRLKKLPKEAFDKVFSFIPFLAKKLRSLVDKIEKHKPDEVECEFSIGLGYEGNIILAKGNINTQFKIRLKWKDIN